MADEQIAKPRVPRWVKVFGIIGLIFAVLVILMVTGVFGEGHGPGRHLGGHGNSKTDSAGSIGEPADAAQASRTVEIATLDRMSFEPAAITVSGGETVMFSVTNTGQTVHEFTLGDSAMQEEHAEMMSHVPAGMGHDTPNSITLRPGETKRLTWRFDAAGTIEYACHQAGHYQAGMRGRISIV